METVAPPKPIGGALSLLVKARQAAIDAARPFAHGHHAIEGEPRRVAR